MTLNAGTEVIWHEGGRRHIMYVTRGGTVERDGDAYVNLSTSRNKARGGHPYVHDIWAGHLALPKCARSGPY